MKKSADVYEHFRSTPHAQAMESGFYDPLGGCHSISWGDWSLFEINNFGQETGKINN